jgi:hypothetical protein
MKLSASGKSNLLESANKVYLAYTALDFFKTRSFTTSDGQKSLYELCTSALTNKKFNQTILIDGVNYSLIITPGSNNTYKVHFDRPLGSSPNSTVKKLGDYEDKEVLNLLTHQDFSLEIPSSGSEPSVSSRINKECVIGGIGKVDLYRTHLVTLYNIIEKIESEDDISNLLVALATGSGKTFVQALWMLILSLSKINSVFAIPDKLTSQFAKDLKRLLPNKFVDNILVLRDKSSSSDVDEVVNSIAQASGTGTIIVGSTERLLDQHYQDLMDANSEHTFLAFDEQHLIMKAERRRVRLIELSKNKLSMFLTATPNQETYILSGNKPVAIMSNAQKEEAGQGQFPRLYTHHARNITDRNKLPHYRFWTKDFWQNRLHSLLLTLINSMQAEISSAAVTLVEDLPFYYHRNESEANVRWRLQVPAARKMLCVIDENETLVNLCYSLQPASGQRRDVYRNGNVINRSDVAEFFQFGDPEVEVIRKSLEEKRDKFRASLQADEQEIGDSLANKSLASQLNDNIFHNFVEYVLTDITGLDEIEHNQLRKHNMDDFKKLVISRFSFKSPEYYQQKLAKMIDPEGAKEIGELLSQLSGVLQSMIRKTFDQDTAQNDKDLTDFIDNWPLFDALKKKINSKDWYFSAIFDEYARSHLIMGVMAGMNDAETPIKESQPFLGLNHHFYDLYEPTGSLVSKAKKRKHTSLEILNDTSKESAFTPKYINITEEMADNYCQLGFIGIYVSNKKSEGFSDRHLHTVINIAEEKLSSTNSPETHIQVFGRNRGLDETIEPAYIHSLGREQQAIFDLEHLQHEDYYPELFKAQKQYNEEYAQILGTQVSQKIIAWIYTNQDKDESVNPDRLKRQVLKFIAQALRDLNNKNSHQIKLSRAQLTDVINAAMKGIDKEIANVNKPYHVSTAVRVVGFIVNFLSACYYSAFRIPAAIKIYLHSWMGKRNSTPSVITTKNPDDVYIKILHNTNFKKMISNLFSVMELRNWLGRKLDSTKTRITKNLESYIKKEMYDDFKVHQQQFLIPLLTKMVIDDKKEQVANALEDFPQLLSFFYVNESILKKLFENNSTQFEETLLALLQQIPGLEHLEITDIVNYPERMADLQKLLTDKPIQILKDKPELQRAFSKHIGNYLKGDFLKYLSALVTYPNVRKIDQLLNKENNAQQFVQHCLNKLIQDELVLAPEAIFMELKSYFKIEEFNRLDEEIQKLKNELSALEAETRNKLIQSLDDKHIKSLANIIKNQLLPVLVNIFPLADREQLLAEASDDIKIRQLLRENGTELSSIMENKKDQLPGFIFSKLITGSLPDQIDIEQHKTAAKAFISQKFKDIMQTGYVSLFVGKFISPSAWSLKPKYVYDVPITQLLKSDEFLDQISLMLPYDQWVRLKTNMSTNKKGVIGIARILIDKAEKGELEQLAPDDLINLFNQKFETNYEGSEAALKRTADSIEVFSKQIKADPLAALNQKTKHTYIQLIVHRLLPIFASFIKDDRKKEKFLGFEREEQKLFDFITKNIETLSSFADKSSDALKQKVHGLINQLLPEGAKLVSEDLIDPKEHAISSAKKIQTDLQKVTLITFLRSKAFSDLMKDLLNPEEFTLLKSHMSKFEHIDLLADQLLVRGINTLDKETIINLIKSSDSSLADIATMDDKAEVFRSFISKMTAESSKLLDTNKMSEMASDLILPIIFHKQFIAVIDEILGFLDEQELALLLEGLHYNEPVALSKQLVEFMHLIRIQDKEALTNRFISLPSDTSGFDIEKLPAKKMLSAIKDLVEEVLDCHCHYNGHDRRALSVSSSTPKILDKLSPELSKMQISTKDSAFFHFTGLAQRVFYVDGINKGIDLGGQISADANIQKTKILQRVKTHILRPLWWSTNVSNFSHSVIKTCRDITQGIVAGYFGALNGLKFVFNWITGSTYFTISSKQPDSEDYNNTAFDFSQALNDLDPLDADQVKEQSCQIDVVRRLEDLVAKRPARPGFFAGVSEKPVSAFEAQASDLSPGI